MRGILSLPVTTYDHCQGPDDATITLVVYRDFASPLCQQARQVIDAMQQHFGTRLRYVYRSFPQTDQYPEAQKAAESAEAAGEQGQFWPMHDTLFANQHALDNGHLVEYGLLIGLDVSLFLEAMSTHRHAARVQADHDSGTASGVTETPTVFINGTRYNGLLTVAPLLRAIHMAVPSAAP